MWRSYAALGGGYCSEFNWLELLACSFPPHPSARPYKMTYGDALTLETKELLDVLCEFAMRGTIEAVVAGGWLSILALKFKHPAFEEEREWRLVVQEPEISHLNFRSGGSDVKPYIELCPVLDGSARLPLKRVVFGPTLRNDEVLIETISLMLERYGYTGVAVESSGIPYRI